MERRATLFDCVERHNSLWFNGPYGFVLSDIEIFPTPTPLNGSLGFFGVDWPEGSVGGHLL